MYRLFSYVYPKKIRESYARLLKYANIKTEPMIFLGASIIYGSVSSLALAFIISYFFDISFWLVFLITAVVIQAGLYFFFSFKVDARSKAIELILPDALQLMASNLKAGLTTDKALLLSARPEFGPFKDELNLAGKEVATGKDITIALMDVIKRVRSDVLEKTFHLITSGIKSGGELAILLEQVSRNLRQQNLVQEKIRSNVLMYIIFIFSAIGFGAPILFGLSSFLVEVLSAQLGAISIPTEVSLPIAISAIGISQSFIIKYVILSLSTTSILGSFVLGLIVKGKERAGVKYIPFLITLTMGIFFLIRFLMKSTLGVLFGG